MPTSPRDPAARARSMRGQGLTQRAIADELAVSRTTVVRWLDPAYAERDRRRSREAKQLRRVPCERCRRPLSYDRPAGVCRACRRHDAVERHERIARLYESGRGVGEVARQVGLHPTYVRAVIARLARARRVTARYPLRDRASVRARDRRVRVLHARGRSRRAIADAVGLNPASIATVLTRLRE